MKQFDIKHSILIVDDEKAICDGLSRLLSNDYIIYQAHTGREAIEILRNNEDIDLILCDIIMPEMDGAEMIERIRSENKEISIIVITACTSPEQFFRIIKNGINACLMKPVDIENLEQTIRDVLQYKNIQLEILTA